MGLLGSSMFGKAKAFMKNPVFLHIILPIIVLILLVAVFYLPDNLKEQYALRGDLEYAHSHCITLISSHYIHMDIQHLQGNVVAFLVINFAILVLWLLDLQTKAEKDELAKRTYIVHLVNLLLLPPVISECVLRYPFFAYSYGFSGIVYAYLGYLYALFLATRPVLLDLKLFGTRYTPLMIVLFISLGFTPWVGGSSVLLICAVLLFLDVRKTGKQTIVVVLTVYFFGVSLCLTPWVGESLVLLILICDVLLLLYVRKTGKQREVLKELLITIVVAWVVCYSIQTGIPLRIIYENINNIGIGAHYMGLLFGSLINAFIIVEGKIWLLALLLLLVLALVLVSPLPAV